MLEKGGRMSQARERPIRIALFGLIPALAIGIATRQAYLNTYHGLSTWKGGGMGMFASADSGDTRYTRIYIETPDGRREPIIRMTPAQDMMLQRALWYPKASNFEALASSLRRTSFVAADRPNPVSRNDVNGDRIGPAGRSHYLLNADSTQVRDDEPAWTLVIEYWTLSFDPQTRLVTATQTDILRFGPKGA